MSVKIERHPSVEPIRSISVSCAYAPKDYLELSINPDGGITALIQYRHEDQYAEIEIAPDDADTLLQALAELRRDRATNPF